jgi:hypothetical protein
MKQDSRPMPNWPMKSWRASAKSRPSSDVRLELRPIVARKTPRGHRVHGILQQLAQEDPGAGVKVTGEQVNEPLQVHLEGMRCCQFVRHATIVPGTAGSDAGAAGAPALPAR